MVKYIFYVGDLQIAVADAPETIQFWFVRYPNGRIEERFFGDAPQPIVDGAQTL